MLHMQHHFLCNITFVVIEVSIGVSLKYTTIYHTLLCMFMCISPRVCTVLQVHLYMSAMCASYMNVRTVHLHVYTGRSDPTYCCCC